MPLKKNLILLKVLAVVAWADGELTNSEHNVLKKLNLKFRLNGDEIAEIQPYLRAPVPKREQDALLRDFAAEMGSPKHRQAAFSALEEMAAADQKLKPEEAALLEHCRSLLGQSTLTRRSFGKIRSFFKRTLFKPAREKNPEMVHYFRDLVFHKLKVRSGSAGTDIRIEDDALYFLCLLGTLLASVAEADGTFDASEKRALKGVLGVRQNLDKAQVDLLVSVLEEQARTGFDFDEVVREFNRVTPYNDRLLCVDCFFAIAAADGKMAHEEMEEIRRITKAMRVPHRYFIERKLAALEKLRN